MIRRVLYWLMGESELIIHLRNEIESLKSDRARLEDLLLQKVGLLSQVVLPGVEQSSPTPIHVPSRRQLRLEAEMKYNKLAEAQVEEMRKEQ